MWLLKHKYRNLFQNIITKDYNNKDFIKKITKIILTCGYSYIIFKINISDKLRLIVFSNSFDINKLDITFGYKYAKQLGNFYVCASDDFSSHDFQILIQVRSEFTGSPIYAQMCKKNMIIQNINKFFIIMNKLKKILYKLDDTLTIDISLNNN